MENCTVLTRKNPNEDINWFSKFTFLWFYKLVSECTKIQLKINDLFVVSKADESERLTDLLEKNWRHEIAISRINNLKPSFLKAIRKTFFWSYMFYGIFTCLDNCVLRSLQPTLLLYFLNLFSNKTTTSNQMYIFGSLILLVSLISILFEHHSSLILRRIGMRARIACSSLIYRKVLKLSCSSMEQSSAGQIINLLSNDLNRFDLCSACLHYIWISPLAILIFTTLTWNAIGISGFIAMVSMIILDIPMQFLLGKLLANLRYNVTFKVDNRINKMYEIVSGIQVIKMFAWESPFSKIINDIRIQEVNIIAKGSYIKGLILCSSVCLQRIIVYISLVTYTLFGNVITPSTVFPLLQIVNTLQVIIGLYFPFAINYASESLISIDRIETFLLLEEKYHPIIQRTISKEIILKNVQASWITGRPTLKNISSHIPSGSLCALIGPVGSGKSSLLYLLLGELVQEFGNITVGGRVSYASQKPWLFPATIRENILFGRKYDPVLYKSTIRACALKKDLELFPLGDETLVGEKGVSLSGGQKARINLARAVYTEGDIFLLDDPLSAVDTNVGTQLFEHCVLEHLADKTRILVTHQLQYLKHVDYIIVLNNGKIESQGTFNELIKININFTKLLVPSDYSTETLNIQNKIDNELSRARSIDYSYSSLSLSHMHSQVRSLQIYDDSQEVVEEDDSNTFFTTPFEVFKSYIKYGCNKFSLCLIIALLIFGQLSCVCGDLWITYWTSEESTVVTNSTLSNTYAISIYTLILFLIVLLQILGALYLMYLAMNASKCLHNDMFKSLLRAPMNFFHTNTSGKILNRFARDTGIVDDVLPQHLHTTIQMFLIMSGIVILVLISNYYMLPIVIILGILILKIIGYFIKSARNLKHLEGTAKSPLFLHVNNTWNGIVTVRNSEMQKLLQKEFDTHQNVHTSAWYLTIVAVQAFGIWIDFITLFFLSCVIFCFIIMDQYNFIDGSLIGLAVSQSTMLTGLIQFGVTESINTISQLTCVERILQYTNLKSEDSADDYDTYSAIDYWPSHGEIRFDKVYLRYSIYEAYVLKNLHFLIYPREKIGIVGRTGAGKSSLISALFRLSPIEGNIHIDDINTQNVPLNILRSHISIIPQEPTLFSHTIRYNLDPFGEFSDNDIWNVLNEVELQKTIMSLDSYVQEGGSNFSVGERQLICLARALMRKNKILVLDEATANVDPKTDSLIQETIRRKFKKCTVLTIAHRLHSVMDCDRIMVLNTGKIVEFDHSYRLLQNADGYFHKMCTESNFNQLKDMAKKAYLIKN